MYTKGIGMTILILKRIIFLSGYPVNLFIFSLLETLPDHGGFFPLHWAGQGSWQVRLGEKCLDPTHRSPTGSFRSNCTREDHCSSSSRLLCLVKKYIRFSTPAWHGTTTHCSCLEGGRGTWPASCPSCWWWATWGCQETSFCCVCCGLRTRRLNHFQP